MKNHSRLPLVVVNTWHHLNNDLGKQFTVSEAAVAHLFSSRLIRSGHCQESSLCPESFYLDDENCWRRIDLLVGKDILFETGKRRTTRSPKIQSAIEFKVESDAITLKAEHIERDCEKLERFAQQQLIKTKSFSLFALFRSKSNHIDQKSFWKAQSKKNRNVRIVLCFPSELGMETHQFHDGQFWDLGKNGGNFYRGWELTSAE